MSPAVLVVAPTPKITSVHKPAPAIPIVGLNMTEPVALGLAASLAHPGGNITGVAYSGSAALNGKVLALLKELVPSTVRVFFKAFRRSSAMT
jgi:putative ABC transport system substrate-binding protein